MTPLRLHRLARGWAQWELAQQSGVSTRKVSFAERGLPSVLSLADRRRLAAALDAAVHVLFPHVKGGARETATACALGDEIDSEVPSLPVPRL
jgi:transcriptional regulator with XRE-family HTH domain